MLSVIVFEGGEALDSEDIDRNEVTVSDWTREELLRVISDAYGDDWADDPIDLINGTSTCGESLTIINHNLAQAVMCGTDGGMIYVVRC